MVTSPAESSSPPSREFVHERPALDWSTKVTESSQATLSNSFGDSGVTSNPAGRRRFLLEVEKGFDFEVGPGATKPSDCNRASMSLASPAGPSSSIDGTVSTVSVEVAALGRVLRARRPTFSPLRSFSSKLSRTDVSSFSEASS